MEPHNRGSFGAAIAPGAGNLIMEALARRGVGASPTTAQSSISQTPTPPQVPQNTSPALPQSPTTGISGQNVADMPPQTTEAELIIRALDSRLKSLSKLSEAQIIPQKPPTPPAIGSI